MCSDTEPSCVLDLDIIITSLAQHNSVAHPSHLCRVVLKVGSFTSSKLTGQLDPPTNELRAFYTSAGKSHPVFQRQLIISLSIISTYLNSPLPSNLS